jgi:hypothetical protein
MPIQENPMSAQSSVPDGTFVKEIAGIALAKPEKFDLFRRKALVDPKGAVHFENDPNLPVPARIDVTTLTAVVDYFKAFPNATGKPEQPPIVVVKGPAEVEILTPDVGEQRQPFVWLRSAVSYEEKRFGKMLDLESFIVFLQTGFDGDSEVLKALDYCGSLKSGVMSEIEDDGFSQKVTTKVGVTRQGQIAWTNPIMLCPWRTFPEIDQPASPFILRLNHDSDEPTDVYAALFEADGGSWKRDAIAAIGVWLRAKLPEGAVVLS